MRRCRLTGPPDFSPTHRIPRGGLPTYASPDPRLAPGQRIGPRVDVEVIEQRNDGWASIRCSNGWTAWLDGRLLIAPEVASPSVGINSAVALSTNLAAFGFARILHPDSGLGISYGMLLTAAGGISGAVAHFRTRSRQKAGSWGWL